MDPKQTIEDIILMDSHRGMDLLRPYLPPAFCEDAAKEILSWKRGPVLLATGFYVAGHAETDGPAGTVVLAKALQKLGFEPCILTDEACSHYFEPEGLDVIYMGLSDGGAFEDELLRTVQPCGMISIERCGRNVKGDYANMHGESVRNHTAKIDELFEKAYGSVPTIGVGDGGNEIGMGKLADVIEEKLDLMPCRVKTDCLVIASVSNWGAYGITAYVAKLTGEPVFPALEEVERYLSRTILLGSVDGVLQKNVCSVDGYPLAESEMIYRLLQQAVTA